MALKPLKRQGTRRQIRNYRRDVIPAMPWGRTDLPKITVLDQDGRWNHEAEDEFLWWPRVLWIDPGVVSGVAVVWFDPVAMFTDKVKAKQILAYSEIFLDGPESGPNGQENRFLRLRRTLNQEAGLASGIETFVMRQFNQDEEFLSPVRIRAGIEALMSMEDEPSPLFLQSPSDAMSAFTNDRLRHLNMYTPGPDHVNDAKRHCLLWMSKIRQLGIDEFKRAHGEEEGWWA